VNCKQDQLAWIKVPAEFECSGLGQLNNRIVKTVALDRQQAIPTWLITPPQQVCFALDVVDASGVTHRAGSVRETSFIPDAFLRPFDPNSAPETDDEVRELERTA
jgi:hypothetical protein